MEGHCSTGQSPQWAVVPMEEEEEEEEEEEKKKIYLTDMDNSKLQIESLGSKRNVTETRLPTQNHCTTARTNALISFRVAV